MNPFSHAAKGAARAAATLAAMAVLLLAVGCGFGGGGNGGGGGGGGNNGFSNASMNGHYAFTMRGYGLLPGSLTLADYFVEGGVLTADGNGHITAGTDDFVQNNTFFSDPFTGIYSINSDGTGDVRFNFAGGPTLYRITLSDSGHFYMAEKDGFRTSSGTGEKQDSATLSAFPTGIFASRNHDLGISATMAQLGISVGGVVTGSYYVLEAGGGQFAGPVTGSILAPANADGRGTLNYTLNGSTHTIKYYTVSAGKFRMLDITPTILSVGQAEVQSAASFANSSLSGSYAFGSSGETAFADGIHTIGVLTADGAGNIPAGNFDSVEDGVVSSDVALTVGTYSIDSDGYGVITNGSDLKVIWMVSPSRAYFVALNAVNLEDGILDKQTGTFSNSSLNKQSAFFMDGFDEVQILFKDRVGTLTPNGSGSVRTNYVSSFFDSNLLTGGSKSNAFSGTYSVTSNGRATAQLNGFTDNLVFYLVSNNTGYFLQGDALVDIGGAFTQQVGP